MAYVTAWQYSGNTINNGSSWFCVSCLLQFDPSACTKDMCSGRLRFGYIANDHFATDARLVTPNATIPVAIDDHQTGFYYFKADFPFNQSWGTAVDCSCSLSYTSGSGVVYSSSLSKTVTLMHPMPSNFDELNLTVNGIKMTQNLQVFQVDDIDASIDIAFNVNIFAGSYVPTSTFFIIQLLDQAGQKVNCSFAADSPEDIPYSSGSGPTTERITVNTSIRQIFEMCKSAVSSKNDMSAEINAAKQRQISLAPGTRWRLSEWQGNRVVQMAEQFINADLYKAGYMPVTLNISSNWGSSAGGRIYIRTGEYFTDGPSFVIAYGPFFKHKDSSGVVNSIKLCTVNGPLQGYGSSNVPVEYNQGGYKDSSGTVRQLKNQGI